MAEPVYKAPQPPCVSVSQVTRRLSLTVKADKNLRDVFVRGELSDFTYHRASGHCFFTLKDEAASIRGIMYSNYSKSLSFLPESGMQVKVRCSVDVYEKDGTNRLYVTEMQQQGEGENLLLFQRLKERLENEGVFATKRPIPAFPKTICIITSENGAALWDMLTVLQHRCPIVKVIFIPVLVQGIDAPDVLISALKTAQTTDAEVILFGRGGGSSEDLSAFNHEELVRTVAKSKIPTISAIGHETDFTLCDFAADLRAPTPTAAAQYAVPDLHEIIQRQKQDLISLKYKLNFLINRKSEQFQSISERIALASPQHRLREKEEKLDLYYTQIQKATERHLQRRQEELIRLSQVLRALDPMMILNRGYAAVSTDEGFVTDAAKLKPGQSLHIRLAKGSLTVVVQEIYE